MVIGINKVFSSLLLAQEKMYIYMLCAYIYIFIEEITLPFIRFFKKNNLKKG